MRLSICFWNYGSANSPTTSPVITMESSISGWLCLPGDCYGLSSFASFCSTSDSIPEDTKTWFLLSIGFMTTCSSILQSITGCHFDLKKEKFKKAAVDYDFLINKINLK